MSAEEAKKLISEGLAKLQEGLNQLCEIVDGLETADEDNLPSRFKRPQMPTNGFRENYTGQQIAERWQVSDDTVRNTFFNEPGVLKIGGPSRLAGGRKKKLTRHWFLLRIPESVLERVENRLMNKGRPPGLTEIPGSDGGFQTAS
jgi:hypothetical protein